MPELMSFENVLEAIKGQCNALLLGNGFSMGFNKEHFDYSNLANTSTFATTEAETLVKKHSGNFEKALHAIETTLNTLDHFGLDTLQTIRDSLAPYKEEIQQSLINAVKQHIDKPLNPELFNLWAEKILYFKQIYTLNYDLLLYWLIMETNNKKHDSIFRDGFYHNRRWTPEKVDQNIFYLHGALHLETKMQEPVLNTQNNMMEIFIETYKIPSPSYHLRNGNVKFSQLLFVAEGTSAQKESRLRSEPYLRHNMYRLVTSPIENLVIYGCSFDQDTHIVDAIKMNKNIKKIYYGIYDYKDTYRGKTLFSDMDIEFFDSKTLLNSTSS